MPAQQVLHQCSLHPIEDGKAGRPLPPHPTPSSLGWKPPGCPPRTRCPRPFMLRPMGGLGRDGAFEPSGWPSGFCDPEPQGLPKAQLRELVRYLWVASVAPSPGPHSLGPGFPISSTWSASVRTFRALTGRERRMVKILNLLSAGDQPAQPCGAGAGSWSPRH